MDEEIKRRAIIFGGAGFIGLHFAKYLLGEAGYDHILLADINPPEKHPAAALVSNELIDGRITYQSCDVRREIESQLSVPNGDIQLIANFAAVHREPGHEVPEYFLTNIPGAINVCAFAEQVKCKTLLFTSSISPYGPSETPKDESSVPTPETAYGSSKLAAEWIHRAWQNKMPDRRLLIVRPGVVFGPGEGGNVSRLVKAISRGFFVYAGNRDTRKAGIYVRELCHACWWCLVRRDAGVCIYNMSMNPGPSIQEYVSAVEKALGKKALIPTIPAGVLLLVAGLIGFIARALSLNTGINYVRARKMTRSNNIQPSNLVASGYLYRYTLQSAMSEWKEIMPAEWK